MFATASIQGVEHFKLEQEVTRGQQRGLRGLESGLGPGGSFCGAKYSSFRQATSPRYVGECLQHNVLGGISRG